MGGGAVNDGKGNDGGGNQPQQGYTWEEVVANNWFVISDVVYDLTNYNHETNLASYGTDLTEMLTNKHGIGYKSMVADYIKGQLVGGGAVNDGKGTDGKGEGKEWT